MEHESTLKNIGIDLIMIVKYSVKYNTHHVGININIVNEFNSMLVLNSHCVGVDIIISVM